VKERRRTGLAMKAAVGQRPISPRFGRNLN
jgi:hypothetical protein